MVTTGIAALKTLQELGKVFFSPAVMSYINIVTLASKNQHPTLQTHNFPVINLDVMAIIIAQDISKTQRAVSNITISYHQIVITRIASPRLNHRKSIYRL